ncbi:MAG: hypothetical protein KAG61_05410 [Bacteriovoracaceae bacterium]|nr:hypothetical protein [Bacteriovoracaceae bacterium]
MNHEVESKGGIRAAVKKMFGFGSAKGMTLYVGNLRYSRDEKGIKFLLSKYGKVKTVKLVIDYRTKKSKGFAFVEMGTSKGGREAIQKLDGTEIDGRTLKVSEAISQDEKDQKVRPPKNRDAYKKRVSRKGREEKRAVKSATSPKQI